MKSKTVTSGQGEGLPTGYLLGYDYIKRHCRLIGAHLSQQKELDANPKAIQLM